jgi:hypothetical protein
MAHSNNNKMNRVLDFLNKRYGGMNIIDVYTEAMEIVDIYEVGNTIFFQLADTRHNIKGDKYISEIRREMLTYFKTDNFVFTRKSEQEMKPLYEEYPWL